MSQNLKKEKCTHDCDPDCPRYIAPETRQIHIPEVNPQECNILPWIKDGSYKSEEFQKEIAELIKQIYGDRKPGTLLWDLNNRTVI